MRLANLGLLLLLPAGVPAQEAADRAQIQQILTRLNADPTDPGLFTAGFEDRTELLRLLGVVTPMVTISHQPWGEATLSIPPWGPRLGTTFIPGEIRFLTTDLAVAEWALVSWTGERPVLIVLRKQDRWRIGSFHAAKSIKARP